MTSIDLIGLSDSELIELRTKINEILVSREATDWKVAKKFVVNTEYGGFSLSAEGFALYNQLSGHNEKSSYKIPRYDPYLIEVVSTLGDRANASCAKLNIQTEKLSPGAICVIRDYDGIENLIVVEPQHIKNLGGDLLYMV